MANQPEGLPVMTQGEALNAMRYAGGMAFLRPNLARDIANAFGLDIPALQSEPVDHINKAALKDLEALKLRGDGFLCADLAVSIADSLYADHPELDGIREYRNVSPEHYLERCDHACTFIAACLEALQGYE